MSSSLAVVNVTTRNYLYRTRVLYKSVAKIMPGSQFTAVCADEISNIHDISHEPFPLIEALSLGIPRFKQLALALDPTALCCMLKAHAVKNALKNPKITHVLYIDNDMVIYDKPAELLLALKKFSFVLTPHHLNPLPRHAFPSEQLLVDYGVFNAGIFGLKKGVESGRFLDWWLQWMMDPRRVEQKRGYDQIWMNYIPVYLKNVHILRNKAYNVAFWNLYERDLAIRRNNRVWCGNEPLVSFHFSNFSEEHPESLVWPRVTSNFKPRNVHRTLTADITNRWAKAGRDECKAWGYGFAKWPDGVNIKPIERDIIKRNWDNIPKAADPWDRNERQGRRLVRLVRSQKHKILMGKVFEKIKQLIKART